MCIMIGLHWRPVQNIKPYNPPNYWIKLTTWLKLDEGYQTISAVWFEISRLILFHGINKGQETSMENKRIRFAETSDGELRCWLTIQNKATREKSIRCAATIFVRSLWKNYSEGFETNKPLSGLLVYWRILPKAILSEKWTAGRAAKLRGKLWIFEDNLSAEGIILRLTSQPSITFIISSLTPALPNSKQLINSKNDRCVSPTKQ